ncbi:FYVE, RhoGEF and PH domain-containing protein 5-like isoform X1 [Pangasianodon hypophthalmus]|uniref:FYVE, RhoGEF and PH domain-containing protein 5-like isoform X1 n=1 Tax=Pangasianodon hypophthalmus TaxID=310915 RepID=UPI0023071DFA|nr:FYVE, RhoGEF and PH domain-containing protein 5-like isoform X1 [Pangasianodon hypophthalmus]
MSEEFREHYMKRSQIQARCLPNGQLGHPVPGKCCQNQGCKPPIFSKARSNPTHGHGLNNYLKRHTKQNLRPANSEQHPLKNHRKEVLTQWEESQLTEVMKQKPWKDIKCKERSMQWEELAQGDQEEQENILEQGDELGCGEELAQGNGLDWQVGLEPREGFNLREGQGSAKLLSDSYNKVEEEMQGVEGQLHMEEERKEVCVNGKTRSLVTPVDSMLSSTYSFHKQIVHNDGINQNKTRTLVKLSDKTYTNDVFTDQNFLNGFYPNNSYINGLNTDALTPDRTDIVTVFPEACDAGEALADPDGFSECDLFEHNIEPSWKSGVEDVGDCGDTVMLSVEEDSENSSGSLATFGEGCIEEVEEQEQQEQVKNLSLSRNSNSDPKVYPKSEIKAETLSEFSDHSFSSFCSSESEVTLDEVERTETKQNHENAQDGPETEQAVSSELKAGDCNTSSTPSVSSIVSLQTDEQKSQQKQEDSQDGQEVEGADILCGKTVMATKMLEEHVYEETEPKFQTRDFLQTRKYLMTRSISVETPRLDPLSTTISGKGRLMLHPQSYYTRHNYLGDSLPALTGSLGCLSPGSPCPPTVDIPPPFELSSITRRPIRKSTPALPSDVTACNRKLDFGLKRYFLPLRFLRKTERRTDSRSVSSRSSSESSPQGSCRRLNLVRQCTESPELHRAHDSSVPSSPSSLRLHKNMHRQGVSTPLNNNFGSASPNSRDMLRVESDDLIHSLFVQPFPLSKPRSFSSPNVDSSIYENVLNTSPHYENVHVRLLSPSNQNQRNQGSANDTDGYVDMSSLPSFQSKSSANEQETESAYTICSPMVRSDGTMSVSVGVGCTKEEEKKAPERLTVNCSRAFYTVKELLDSETQHVKILRLLIETAGADEQLMNLWSDLPAICSLHQDLHTQLESRIKEWDQKEGIADILLAKKAEFSVFSSFISQHDSKVRTMEQMENTQLDISALKQQLLQVIARVLQYRMLLTDYKNNLSLDAREYEDIQAALVMVSDVADQAKDSLKNGADLLRLISIEHSVQGLKNLLQPGRVFVKEGTLMKVSRKCKQPRHLFLMSDIMLYTYPQQDGKYRLINTLALTGMEVTRHLTENTQNALKIEVKDISITLLASSSIERDDWFVTLNRTVADLGSLLIEPPGSFEVGEKSGVCLGENAPPLVSVSQVAVCMNCPVHFSLTHRRHHCHACGKVVCRDCCRNKVPLKYMKNRRAKVCNKCYSELCKNEGDTAVLMESSSRPLSAVFQNIHPTSLWRSRKGHLSFNQVTGSEGEMSGTLQRSRNSKRSWRSLWFLLKDKVLYTYPQPEERVACESLPLLGFSVKSDNEGESSVFQLYHNTTLYYTFKAQDTHTAQRWVSAMEEATVL